MNQRENCGVWRWLGRFALDAGSEVLLHASDNGVVVADGIRVVRVEGLTGGLYPVHVDHLGTPRAVTTLGGQVVWRWESDPFGELSANEDPDGDGRTFTLNLRMPGQYADEETGLFYNYFRYYDPATGRYITSDPIGLDGGLNTYSYVGENPATRADPRGLAWIPSADRRIKDGSSSQCGENCKCWLTCLMDDPLLPDLLPGLGAPLAGIKKPSQIRPGASKFGSIDRRFPWLPGANPNLGPEVRRVGRMQRVKCLGRYGTAAAGLAAFTAGYSIGAAGRCWVECY